jgi:hypothetical protein
MPLPVFVSETLHHEAIDWASRVSSNGGTISSSVIRGVSAFCADIDRQGLRDRFARLSIFSGGNLSGALVPLYRSFAYGGTLIGSATDTNVNFVSGDFAESGASAGLTGNGTTKHLECGPSILSQLSVGNAHLSAFGSSLIAAAGVNVMGAGGSGFNSLAALQTSTTATNRTFINGTPTLFADSAAGLSSGHLIASAVATNDLRIFHNGTQNGSTLTSTRSGSLTANSVFVFSFNNNGTATQRIASRLTSYSIGRGLTAAQAAAFSSALSALNTALGR